MADNSIEGGAFVGSTLEGGRYKGSITVEAFGNSPGTLTSSAQITEYSFSPTTLVSYNIATGDASAYFGVSFEKPIVRGVTFGIFAGPGVKNWEEKLKIEASISIEPFKILADDIDDAPGPILGLTISREFDLKNDSHKTNKKTDFQSSGPVSQKGDLQPFATSPTPANSSGANNWNLGTGTEPREFR